MIRAYDKVYLDKARTALGRMLDFAVYDLKSSATGTQHPREAFHITGRNFQ